MYNRAKAVDEAFIRRVTAGDFPKRPCRTGRPRTRRSQTATHRDRRPSRNTNDEPAPGLMARELRARGEGYYTIRSGHRATLWSPAFSSLGYGVPTLPQRSVSCSKEQAETWHNAPTISSFAKAAGIPLVAVGTRFWGPGLFFRLKRARLPPTFQGGGNGPRIRRAHNLGLPLSSRESIVLCSFGDASLNP